MPLVTETDAVSQQLVEFVESIKPFKEVEAKLLRVDSGNLIEPFSRYRQHHLVKMVSSSGSTRTIETWEKIHVNPDILTTDQYYNITSGTAYRPELIAHITLRNKFYWWWIMHLNNIFDITQLTPGKTLLIRQPPVTPLARVEFEGV